MRIVVGLLVLWSSLAVAKDWPCTRITTFPALLDGCEGEKCEKADNKIRKNVVLYEKPDLKSKVVGRLKAGQTVLAHRQKTLVLRPGRFMVEDDREMLDRVEPFGVQKGDVVLALQYVGENNYNLCIGDKFVDGWGKELEPLKTEGWSFLRSKNGSGWVRDGDWYESMGE